MTAHWRRIVWLAVIGIVWLAGVGETQIVTGSIIGSIKDSSDLSLPGVMATLTSPALPSGPVVATSAEGGDFRFVGLPPGNYTLVLELPGFGTYREEGLRVVIGGTVERNVTMQLASVAEAITVVAQSPMVDTRRVNVTTTVEQETIENLPTARVQLYEFAKWVPGVTARDPSGSTASNGTYSVFGSPNAENSFYVDGFNAGGISGGQWIANNALEPQEFTLVTLGASAEYQLAQGGVLNFVLPSGTNEWRGDISASWHPDALVSKPIELPCNCDLGQTGFVRTEFKDWKWTGGGPIVRDHLWFYGAQTFFRKQEHTPGADYRQTRLRNNHGTLAKATWQMTNAWRSRFTLNNSNWRLPGVPTLANPHETVTISGRSWGPLYGTEFSGTLSNATLLTFGVYGWSAPGQAVPLSGDLVTSYHRDAVTGIACCGVQTFSRETNRSHHTQYAKMHRYFTAGWSQHDLRFGVQSERRLQSGVTVVPSGVWYQDAGGLPDQATFQEPSIQAGEARGLGFWAEDQVALWNRLTLSLGVRYDRMRAVSPDHPVIDTLLNETGGTIRGLGEMFVWNAIAPRLGLNVKLSDSGHTLLRATYGRAHKIIDVADLMGVYPGIAPATLARYNPATGGYTTIVSVTNSASNVRVDPDSEAPYTDQYSLGLDQQLAANVGLHVSFVHKEGRKQIGYQDIGGIYNYQTTTLPDGRLLPVFQLANSPSERVFLLTNGPGHFTRYNGFVVAVEKRFSDNWRGTASYTYGKAKGNVTTARDPNAYINGDGLVPDIDRPHVIITNASYDIPWIDTQIVANYLGTSGYPYAPQALVRLQQGNTTINIAPADGMYRMSFQHNMDMRINKTIWSEGPRRFQVSATIENLLQASPEIAVVSQNYFSGTFGQPASYIKPREMHFLARFSF